MGRKITLNCDFCSKEIEMVSAKVYLAPTLPGKTMTSFQSQYTHYGDACESCMAGFQSKMKRREPRNGTVLKSQSKKQPRKKKAANG